jgi:hypothetical protein
MRYKLRQFVLKVGWSFFSFALTNLLSAEGELKVKCTLCERSENNCRLISVSILLWIALIAVSPECFYLGHLAFTGYSQF